MRAFVSNKSQSVNGKFSFRLQSKVAWSSLYIQLKVDSQMTTIFARKALLADGWAANVRLTARDGVLQSVAANARAGDADQIVGIVIPGVGNAHSHAFQRALAGRTEQAGPKKSDNFWSWRSKMYALANIVDADRLGVIARQLYAEMLQSGYTSVAEFHYLYRQPGADDRSIEMTQALIAAAAETGIRFTYVPVLYERAGFNQSEPSLQQRQFAMSLENFVAHYNEVRSSESGFLTAIGVHSLRAASADSIASIAEIAKRDQIPMHIHIAEQQQEVADCVDMHGVRPIEYLLREFSVDDRWCLVHATHINEAEIEALVQTGAVVCLCPTTEANLGDGLFPAEHWITSGGKTAIGSDSQVSVNPFEEIRWLEYGQRLTSQKRNVISMGDKSTGRSLFDAVVSGGAVACGSKDTSLLVGNAADLLALDDCHPTLAGHDSESVLDALVFCGMELPIDRVMIAGQWKVVDGKHVSRDAYRQDYQGLARFIGGAIGAGI